MTHDLLQQARRLTDRQLLAQVQRLARDERLATVALVAHLAILDERKLHLDEGFPSLFAYCTEALHLSEHAAYARIEAARAIRRFPLLLARLAEGALTLTTVGLLASHLTPANSTDLLAAATHKSKRQVAELLAHRHPLDPVPSTVRKLPQPPPWPRAAAAHAAAPPQPSAPSTSDTSQAPPGVTGAAGSADRPVGDSPPPHPTPSRPGVVAPLGLERYRVQFTMRAETHDKLRLARDLLSHQIPDGDLAQIFDRALTVLVETLAKEKFAAAARPRPRLAPADDPSRSPSRHIPAEIKRAVWLRDSGRCAFVARSGRRCEARRFLEFHHVDPYGTGGPTSVDNIALRCRAHNMHEAVLFFGAPRRTGVMGDESGLVPTSLVPIRDGDQRSGLRLPAPEPPATPARAEPG
jgi:hypothetical protein